MDKENKNKGKSPLRDSIRNHKEHHRDMKFDSFATINQQLISSDPSTFLEVILADPLLQ